MPRLTEMPGPPASRGWLRRAADYPLFYLMLLVFAVVCLGWSLPAALLARILPARQGQPLGRAGIGYGFRFLLGLMRGLGLLRCDLSALDALRRERGLVIAPNHPSLLDAALVASRLPRVLCITKASLWDNALLGGGVRLAGYLRNDSSLVMIRHAAQALRGGAPLLIFPEGTRSTDHPIGRFSRSFAVIAQRAGAPVQSVLIETDSPYLRKGWPLWRKPPLPLRYRLRLGPRFHPEGSPQRLSDQVEAAMRGALGEAARPRSGE